MKYLFLFILTLFIFSCEKLIELDVRNNAGMLVELEINEGEGSNEFSIIQNRFSDFFPDYNMEIKKVGEGNQYEVQLPTFISSNFVGMLIGGPGKITLAPEVGDKLEITKLQIKDLKLGRNNFGEQIMIQLTEDYGEKWEAMTEKNIGKKITVMVDGMVVSNPRINSPISVGRFSIANENKEYLKMLHSLLKNPADNIQQPKFQTKLFLKDNEGATELPEELIQEYYALQHGFSQNKHAAFQLIDNLVLPADAKHGLKEDIGRMIEKDIGGYLGYVKFNLSQFQDVLRNARKLYDQILSKQKVMEEQRLREVKKDDGLPF